MIEVLMKKLFDKDNRLPQKGRFLSVLALSGFLALSLACRQSSAKVEGGRVTVDGKPQQVVAVEQPRLRQMIEAAIEQVNHTKSYDPAYVKLAYPNGDVPLQTGVCSDVVIRAFRKVNIDLQKEVHEDMVKNFRQYPSRWGLKRPDTNIDHRRVPNLMTYFKRQGKAQAISTTPQDYLPGDIVAWDLGGGVTHIGLMTNLLSDDGKTCYVVHNIGAGARVENVLFNWKIIGHYRYF
jgi:uncharacterized protein YijF (DUF1287 family)